MSASSLDEQRIAVLAYEYWIERGRPFGSPEVDWYRAVEVLAIGDEDLPLAAFSTWLNTAAPDRRRHRRAR